MIIKEDVIKELGLDIKNTGATEVQIIFITDRINNLNLHLKKFKKDKACKRGLMVLVGKRARLISYLQRKNMQQYKNLVEKLGLRK